MLEVTLARGIAQVGDSTSLVDQQGLSKFGFFVNMERSGM